MVKEIIMETKELKTLDNAIDYVKDHIDVGVECPCCKRFTKQYKRKLNSGMAYALVKIYKISKNNEYIHITNEEFPPIRYEYSKLRYWGLLECKEKSVDTGGNNNTGFWRITDLGRKFVEKKVKIKERIKLINGKFNGFDGGDINISQALDNKFDYDELMNN